MSPNVFFDVVGLSWVSQRDRPCDAFHTVVNLCQMLNPRLTRCQENEVARLTSQEEGR